ncbi:hypothetical protein GC163_06160 [bacterium]|nr:hypothetical protein [bacterium]
MSSQFAHQQEVESARSSALQTTPHSLECEVHARLSQHPGLTVKSLVVRRIPNGVCLEGRIETQDDAFDPARFVRQIPGLGEVVNHLVVNHISEENCDSCV